MIKRGEQLKEEIVVELKDGVGAIRLRHLLEADEFHNKSRLYIKCIIPPGASIGKHQHVGDCETYFILSGEATVEDDGMITTAQVGDVIFTDEGEFHSIANHGSVDLEYMALILFV